MSCPLAHLMSSCRKTFRGPNSLPNLPSTVYRAIPKVVLHQNLDVESNRCKEFLETRRRELELYLKTLVEDKEIRDSGEIHAFLLIGETTELTGEEKDLQKEKQLNLAHAEEDMQALKEHFRKIMRTTEGVGKYYNSKRSFLTSDLEKLYNLYPTLKNTPSMAQLDPDFAKIVRLLKNVAAHSLYTEFHCEVYCEQVSLSSKEVTNSYFVELERCEAVVLVNAFLSYEGNSILCESNCCASGTGQCLPYEAYGLQKPCPSHDGRRHQSGECLGYSLS